MISVISVNKVFQSFYEIFSCSFLRIWFGVRFHVSLKEGIICLPVPGEKSRRWKEILRRDFSQVRVYLTRCRSPELLLNFWNEEFTVGFLYLIYKVKQRPIHFTGLE